MNHNIVQELRNIAAANHGILRPKDVVNAAKEPNSILHEHFNWDDSDAAHQYRLWQARQLIRVSVDYIQCNGQETAIRTFVSLTPDRKAGGGYREIVAVAQNPDWYSQMLVDAQRDMDTFRRRYKHIKEVTPVIVAMNNVLMKKINAAG